MLELSQNLAARPVMSLRTGSQVATAKAAIINPHNLKIEGFYCDDSFTKETLVLLPQDIRDIVPQGFAVNDHEVLADPDDLVRLKDIIKLKFELIGKSVYTDQKKKLGKISDYAVDNQSMYVKKLYVNQSLMKNFSTGQLSIDRNQIIEVTNKRVVVQDPLQGTKAGAPAPVSATP